MHTIRNEIKKEYNPYIEENTTKNKGAKYGHIKF